MILSRQWFPFSDSDFSSPVFGQTFSSVNSIGFFCLYANGHSDLNRLHLTTLVAGTNSENIYHEKGGTEAAVKLFIEIRTPDVTT